MSRKIPSSFYMRSHSVKCKTHGQEPSTGDTVKLGLDSRKNISTEFLRMGPQSRATSNRSGSIHGPQQPTETVDTSIQ